MAATLITALNAPIIFALRTDDFDRAAVALRYAGYSVSNHASHARRFVVDDTEVPYQTPPALKGPAASMLAPPIALELRTDDIIGAISALRSAGFRVFATPDHPGRYVVEDVYLDVCPIGAA